MTWAREHEAETDILFRLSECPRCARLVFAGRVDGALAKLDTLTVPPGHAGVLHSYRVPIFRATPATGGLLVVTWAPRIHTLRGGDVLLAAHTCGAPRLKGARRA